MSENKSAFAEGMVEWLPERAFREEDHKNFFFHDSLHNNPPMTPMGASVYHCFRGTQMAAEWFSLPFSHGFDFVFYNGRLYASPLPVTDPEEAQRKGPIFEKKLMEALNDWNGFYSKMVDEWTSLLGYLKGIDRSVLMLDKLLSVLRDTIRISKRSWELHFIGMYPCFVGYMMFEGLCHKYGINERDMRIFLQGTETKMYEIDRGLWRLADLAVELGFKNKFEESKDMEELIAHLAKNEVGKVWINQFNDFLANYGRRTTAAIFDPYYKTWIEDPYPAMSTIRTYILKGGFDFEEHNKTIAAERDKFIAETMERIAAEERAEFESVLRRTQESYPFNEDHNFYAEQWTYSEVRYSILECGRRLVKFRILADQEDVFFLTISELEEILDDIVLDEYTGVHYHALRVPSMVKRRKQVWQELHEVSSPPFIGTVPEGKLEDPVFIKIWGMTDDVIRGQAKSKEEVKGKYEGFAGAPGVVEGIAKVIFGYEGFANVMPDDILIAPFTTPAWTPLFSKIKGVATDSGGMLAHAAICAREYNIPAVVGTITRGKKVTEHIKTGMRVRIDGTKGVVEILE